MKYTTLTERDFVDYDEKNREKEQSLTMTGRKILKSIIFGMLLCACLLLAASSDKGKGTSSTYALIMKAKDNPYNEMASEGFKEVIEASGNKCIIEYSEDYSVKEQIAAVKRAMGQNVSAVAVAANDEEALGGILTEAMDQGIHVLTLDSDTDAAYREVFINQVSIRSVGQVMMDAVLDISGGAGQWAILSTTSQASNQNAWIDEMKRIMQQPEYSSLRLVNIAYGMDEYGKSAEETRELIEKYPRLKVICAPTVIGMDAAARVLTEMGKENEIKLTGLGMPDELEPYVGKVCPYFYLWNPKTLGEVTAYASLALVEGEVTGKQSETFYVEGFGTYVITQGAGGGTEVVVENPIRFDISNIKAWSELFSP